MPRIWSSFISLTFLIGVELNSGTCIALPAIDSQVVLQICQAFSKKAPEQMPAVVLPEAAERFVNHYGRFSDLLEGCLSASAISREANGAGFLVQNTRYVSYWYFYADEGSIRRIIISRYKPVTLANDERWQWIEPSAEAPSEPKIAAPTARLPPATRPRPVPPATRPPPGSQIDTAPTPSAKPPAPNTVEFFYATNRKEITEPVASLEPHPQTDAGSNAIYNSSGWTAVNGYTGERNATLSFGAIRVRVPEGHQIGKIELPSNTKIFGITLIRDTADPTKHFTILSVAKTNEDQWIRSLFSTKKKRALIFVHGFNTKFRDAIFRTAQIVWDLQFKGAAVLFSWPSRGEVADYLYDKDSALGSRAALLRVIDDLHKAKFESIDIIAHSMGNLVAVDALSNSAATRSPVAIAQFVMAAPDVDRDMFIQEIPNVAKVAKGLTLYASANDKALLLSKRVAGNIPRAGDVPDAGPIVVGSVSTIDVSAIGDELFGLNHNTFATTRNVLNDLKILLETGKPPPRLTEIRGYPEPPQKATYFRHVP